jgi:xanthine dehydrogenase YagS FAD-binding subunit
VNEFKFDEIKHYEAGSIKKAVSLLHKNQAQAKIVSGGVDVVHLIKREVLSETALIDIKKIPGLSAIREKSGILTIGALARIRDIEKSPLIIKKYLMLAEAAAEIATPQIRNMSTAAGNICQQVWCQYYRRSTEGGTVFDCLRKGGKKCFAVAGNNAEHAIMGPGKCRAVCPSDLATALTALSASLLATGPNSSRMIPLGEFYADMGNALNRDELVTGITVPEPAKTARQYFVKFRLREAIDFAMVSVASVIDFNEGKVSGSVIVLGGVAPAPYRSIDAERHILGKEMTLELAEEAAAKATESARPLKMNAYKVPIAQALVKRALLNE